MWTSYMRCCWRSGTFRFSYHHASNNDGIILCVLYSPTESSMMNFSWVPGAAPSCKSGPFLQAWLLEGITSLQDLLIGQYSWYCHSCRNIFENDDYNPFEVFTDEQFQGALEIFPYQNVALASAPFPKKFPFSAMVYMVYDQLTKFVTHCTDYASKINLRYGLAIGVRVFVAASHGWGEQLCCATCLTII